MLCVHRFKLSLTMASIRVRIILEIGLKGYEMRLLLVSIWLSIFTSPINAAPVWVNTHTYMDDYLWVNSSSKPSGSFVFNSRPPRIPDIMLRDYETVILELHSFIRLDVETFDATGQASARFQTGFGTISNPIMSIDLEVEPFTISCTSIGGAYCSKREQVRMSMTQRMAFSVYEWRLINPHSIYVDTRVDLSAVEATGTIRPLLNAEYWSVSTAVVYVEDFSPVPLPSGLPLAATALGALALVAQRRRA